jgi:hypothetical protein
MSDNELVAPHTAHAALRFFDLALRILQFLLAVVTGVMVVALGIGIANHASFTLPATIEPPYKVDLSNERSIVVDESGDATFTGLVGTGGPVEIGTDGSALTGAPRITGEPKLTAQAEVGEEDNDTRVVTYIAIVLLLGATWLGLTNLRRVVRSARDGQPFDPQNSARMRWVAVAVGGAAVTYRLMAFVVDRTLDSPVPVHVSSSTPGLLTLLLVALGLFALAEVFRAGSELREFEQATI